MDDESWTIFRDKVNKVYSDKRYFRIILIWRFVYILLFPVIDLLRRYTDPTTTHITGLALSLFWLFTFFLLMYYTGPRARKRIHDGLVAVCGEQNASCPDISFQPIWMGETIWTGCWPGLASLYSSPNWVGCGDIMRGLSWAQYGLYLVIAWWSSYGICDLKYILFREYF